MCQWTLVSLRLSQPTDPSHTRKDSEMAHRDDAHYKPRFNFEYLRLSMGFLFDSLTFKSVKLREDCNWNPKLLATTALLWAWSDESLMADRLTAARDIAWKLLSHLEKIATSYQAFMKMLSRWTDNFVDEIKRELRNRMFTEFDSLMRVDKYLLLAVDGSRIGVPRTQGNQRAFSACGNRKAKRKKRKNTQGSTKSCKARKSKSKGSKKSAKSADSQASTPSMWMTTLWHIGTGLPWDWRLGPSNSSEREHWMEMFKDLPESVMFVADAGFVGYEYASSVLEAGHNLVIRVGANVKLIKKLGLRKERGDTVYLWPKKSADQGDKPLAFRLVQCHNGKHPMYLLTSVLSSDELTDANIVKIYKRRWGIELFYRHLKRTYGVHKLKSRIPDHAYIEMQWAILGIWSMAVYALHHLRSEKIPPNRMSFAKLIRAFRKMLRHYLHKIDPSCDFQKLLRSAVIDNYVRKNKASRNYPRKKQESPPGPPTIRLATKQEIQLAKQLLATKPVKLGLTA